MFTGSIARSASRRYLIYSDADIEVFRPAGATRCTDGVKFGTEEGTFDPLLHAEFHPHRCNDKGVGPHKLKFLLRFDQNVEYKRPAWPYPLRDFRKFAEFVPFYDALAVKIWLDFLQGLWSYGGFKLRGLFTPKYSAYPWPYPLRHGSETVRQTPKRFRGARTRSRSSTTMPSLVGLRFHPPPGWPKTLSFLSVCMSLCSSRF